MLEGGIVATLNTLIYEEYMVDGKLYEISKAIVPHKHINRLTLTMYLLTGSNDPNKYCLKNEIKIENIAGRDLWCSKIYVDKDNNATSINCFSFNDEFISLLNYFEKLIEEEYFTEKAINVFGEIKENIKRIGTK